MNPRPPQIRDAHIRRAAVVYIRQSTSYQVRVNVGSTEVQRAIPATLSDWGWPLDRIDVIDDDLGVSGSTPGARLGFNNLVERVRAGDVGLVAVTDTSRLTRNLPDLARFIEVAREHDVLLLQSGQVTDFRDPNSAFIGVILGANTERENRARILDSQRARRKKAEAGIATTHPPLGYVSSHGQWLKNPAPRVRDVVQLIFDKFLELGTTGALARSFHQLGIKIQTRKWNGVPTWTLPTRTRLFEILKHPAYAGVYRFGKTLVTRTDGKRRQVPQPTRQWIWIEDHHEPYVSMAVWLGIQDRLAASRNTPRTHAGRGEALVQGVMRCTFHGSMFRTSYVNRATVPQERKKRHPSYRCAPHQTISGASTLCSEIAARFIDHLVEAELLKVLTVPSLETIETATRYALREYDALVRARDDDMRRAEQAAAALERTHDQTDGEQIHLKKRLSERLEQALSDLDDLRASYRLRPLTPPISLEASTIRELRDILNDLPTLWRSEYVTPQQRKAVLRLAIRVIDATPDRHTWTLDIEWAGGQRTRVHALTRFGIDREVARARQEGLSASEIVEDFNRRGIVRRAGVYSGHPFTEREIQQLLRRVTGQKLAGS